MILLLSPSLEEGAGSCCDPSFVPNRHGTIASFSVLIYGSNNKLPERTLGGPLSVTTDLDSNVVYVFIMIYQSWKEFNALKKSCHHVSCLKCDYYLYFFFSLNPLTITLYYILLYLTICPLFPLPPLLHSPRHDISKKFIKSNIL